MAPLLATLLMVAAGCDRQSGAEPQASGDDASVSRKADYAEPAPDGEAEGGELTGTLDISKRGSPMPDVSFQGPKGEPVKLADFKGKPLLVNLWATWCGPCVAEMPTLDTLAARAPDKLQVIVVSQDGQGKALVDPWWAKQDFRLLKPYVDARSDLGFAFGTGMVPTTVLYDANGKEVWRVVGAMDWDGPRANTLMAEVVG
jgi:thiol-disulfide isomerase/thioredoxin